ncbi:hypothetical protein WJX72_004918 [[Myrmecia] bisecta]|uniref:Protein kinase domain-containing protein n=1 Tax=[Myrmecia] bisecta TaxID=41462 RepID=A0AAW1Q8T4_9CHLO
MVLGFMLLLIWPLRHPGLHMDHPAARGQSVAAGRTVCRSVSVREPGLQVECHSLLGCGMHGAVYKGKWNGAPVAVKVARIRQRHADKERAANRPLLDLGDVLLHPNLVQWFAYTTRPATLHKSPLSQLQLGPDLSDQVSVPHAARFHMPQPLQTSTDHRELVLVTELCDKGTLRDYIDVASHLDKLKPECQLSLKIATLLEIARGVAFLHAAGKVHGNLKASNVLLKYSNLDQRGFSAKLGDYGLSFFLPTLDAESESMCTAPYSHLAPEVLRSGASSPAGDAYSFGVIMAELYGSCRAFDKPCASERPGGSGESPAQGALRGELPGYMDEECPLAYCTVAQQCWSPDPANRPSFPLIILQLSALEEQLREKSVVEELDILFKMMNDRGQGEELSVGTLSLDSSSGEWDSSKMAAHQSFDLDGPQLSG